MSNRIPARGRVYLIDLGEVGHKPFLVVSNNGRNMRMQSFLAVRVTTSEKPPLDSIVRLDRADQPLVGSVLCDELHTFYRDEIVKEWGALSPTTLVRVNTGLRAALALL